MQQAQEVQINTKKLFFVLLFFFIMGCYWAFGNQIERVDTVTGIVSAKSPITFNSQDFRFLMVEVQDRPNAVRVTLPSKHIVKRGTKVELRRFQHKKHGRLKFEFVRYLG